MTDLLKAARDPAEAAARRVGEEALSGAEQLYERMGEPGMARFAPGIRLAALSQFQLASYLKPLIT